MVIVFFSVGQVVLGRTLRNNPQTAMSVALVIYLAKIGVLFVLILLFAGTDLFNTKVFALTIVGAYCVRQLSASVRVCESIFVSCATTIQKLFFWAAQRN